MDKENVVPGGDRAEEQSASPPAAAAAAATPSEPTKDVPACEPAPVIATTVTAATAVVEPAGQVAAEDEEEESDWEDLDEVLDDFSADVKASDNEPAQPPNTSTSTADTAPALPAPPPQDTDGTKGIDEEAFLKQLEASMAEMVGGGGGGGEGEPGVESKMAEQWDALEKQLEASGMQPEDLLKQLMGDMMSLGGERAGEDSGAASGSAASPPTGPTGDQFSVGGGGGTKAGDEDFQSKIQRTMERMQDSGDKATSAAQGGDGEGGVGDELLAKMMKAMEAGAGEGGEPDLMNLFMEMMEDLSHKEMLYEPMKELHTKFGPWLRDNKGKVEKVEMEKYENQAKIVEEIVNKFDEPGYSDQKPEDKSYIWERMQKMQDAGNPPDELIQNPVTEEAKNQLGDGASCPQQ